jgi:hypothetical protein
MTLRLIAAIAVVSCPFAVAACGSASKSAGTADSTHFSQAVKFSECMRAHGVTNFPDPSSGGGIHLQAGSGVNPFSPAFKSAQGVCQKLLPGGGPGAGHPSAQVEAQLLKVSQCMRTHGITGFPDPTTTPPSGPGGFSLFEGHNGVFLAIPSSVNPQSPAFEHAADTCGFH